MKRLIQTFFYSILAFQLYSQDTLIAGKGISSIDLTINSSTLDDVHKILGTDYELIVEKYRIKLFYESKGLIISYDPFDKNKIVRSISVIAPFQAITTDGVILNKTTWEELATFLNSSGGINDKDYVYKPLEGITYYIAKDPNKKGWNKKSVVNKITIHNRNANGIESNIGFEYDSLRHDLNLKKAIRLVDKCKLFSSLKDSLAKKNLRTNSFAPVFEGSAGRELEWAINQKTVRIGVGMVIYELKLLTKNDTILFFNLATKEQSYSKVQDSTLLNLLLKRHQEFYGNQINISNPLEFPLGTYVYGYSCGFVPRPPFLRSKMDSLIENKDYVTLNNWLKSLNPEVQAYGLEGLYRLASSGYTLSKNDILLMNYVAKKSTNLYSCSGCVYGIERKLSEVLKKRQLRKIKN